MRLGFSAEGLELHGFRFRDCTEGLGYRGLQFTAYYYSITLIAMIRVMIIPIPTVPE